MSTLTIRMSDEKVARLKSLAQSKQMSVNKLIDELSTIALANYDTKLRFEARKAKGDAHYGLTLLDELDAKET